MVHRVTTSGTTSGNEWQRMTTSGTTGDNEWYNEWQEVTTNDNEWKPVTIFRDRSRAAATSKMERFVTIVNGWKPLTIITKRSILDVAAALDPPLILANFSFFQIREEPTTKHPKENSLNLGTLKTDYWI